MVQISSLFTTIPLGRSGWKAFKQNVRMCCIILVASDDYKYVWINVNKDSRII